MDLFLKIVYSLIMNFVTHKPAVGKAATKDESKFMVVSFAPAAMNAILTAIQAVR